jgi:hypothetical protein
MIKFLSSKWLSLFCCVVNSTFCTVAWNNGDHFMFVVCAAFASLCAWNFVTATDQEDRND